MSEDPDLRVGRWRRSLLDLTLRNRLLDARVGRTCLALGGDPIAMAARLDDGAELDADFVVGGEELARSLVAIARAARESLAEGGAHTLWVALGLLRWPDGEGQPRHAPLVLWPVEIKKAGEGVRIVGAATEEPRVNETLVEKLRIDHQIAVAVPPADDDGELYLEPIFEAFAAAVAGREGWELVREARLGIFSFTKFVMWNDLGARAGELLDSGVVRALATGVGFPEQEAFPGVDASLGSECPLDADTTQLAAIAAATAGRTFVLQGPPGTGKSQTISNLIARCLADGKTVLFVSEKMAALEVVQRRLAAAGLGDFCLELHSHRASKRAVLDDLGRVLERAWRPVAAAGEDEKLIAARDALDGYARAMHAPTAIGLRIHESLERLLALADAPKLSVELDEAQVAPGWLPQRRDALSEYAAAWNAAGSAQAWRDSDLAEWQLSTRDAVAAAAGLHAEAHRGALGPNPRHRRPHARSRRGAR
jgi:hypothetical protein